MQVRQPRFVARVPEWFPTRKAAQVTAFFAHKAGGAINVLRATKMIYLADRASLAEREFSITGDDYVSMPFGPVNTYTFSYMNGEAPLRAEQWSEFVGPRTDDRAIPLAKPILDMDSLDELSRGDLRILEATWAEFSDIDKYKLADWTHRFCPEWRDPSGSSIPINFSTIFKTLEKPEPIELAETMQADRQRKQLMAG